MRVIEPQNRPAKKQKKRLKFKFFKAVLVVLVLTAVGAVLYKKAYIDDKPVHTNATPHTSPVAPLASVQSTPNSGKIKTFTGEQFRDLYNGFAYPNTEPINENTPITGNQAADEVIRTIAVQRGYRLRSAPVADAFQEVAPGFKLQQRAAQSWTELKAAATKDSIQLGLTAAYRSADDQRQIFMDRMTAAGLNTDMVATGAHNAQVDQLLRTTAIPGYSRHHTGYTVDISCTNQSGVLFENSICFKWLSNNNYEQAKKSGWIPSYPSGAGSQGPDPESWEYVWVGLNAVTE